MEQSFDAQRFRQALGAFPTGVTIVTAVDATGADVGMTASSFNSASLTPPMVLWSLGRSSTNFAAFLQAKHFAVHILATDQDALAARFSQRGIDRFAGLRLDRGPDGIALLEGAAARFECRTAFQYEGGDHVIFVGEVLGFEHWEREPLVFKRGRFALAADKISSPASSATDLPQPATPRALEPDDAMAAYAGTRMTEQVVQRLQHLGLVHIDAAQRLHLTEAGRRTVVELLAVAQAASVEGEKSFDATESRALRQLLKSVIESTDPGIPQPRQP